MRKKAARTLRARRFFAHGPAEPDLLPRPGVRIKKTAKKCL